DSSPSPASQAFCNHFRNVRSRTGVSALQLPSLSREAVCRTAFITGVNEATMNRRTTRRRQSSTRLAFERLEDRALLAGNVAASISGGSLRIVGDALDNQVLVERASATRVRLTPMGDTTVNGSADPVTLGGFRRGITLNTGSGDDEFQFAG